MGRVAYRMIRSSCRLGLVLASMITLQTADPWMDVAFTDRAGTVASQRPRIRGGGIASSRDGMGRGAAVSSVAAREMR